MIRPIRAGGAAALAGAVLTLALDVACGSKGPTTPTAGGPSPSPSASPTPAPTPTPPTASNPALPLSCRGIPDGTGTPRGCAPGSSAFFSQVGDAVQAATVSTFKDTASGQILPIVDGQHIVSPGAYLSFITSALDKQGICAVYDGEELTVRTGNGFSENFDIITSTGDSWVKYNVTCNPALPIPPLPPPPVQKAADCKMPPSSSLYCTAEPAQYDGDVYGAQDDLIAEDQARATPQVFDFSSRLSNTTYGYKILNDSLYVSGMLQKLKARGYCAFFDGEEFEVKKGTNTFSENYDLTKSDGYAIRLYEVTCRDAAF